MIACKRKTILNEPCESNAQKIEIFKIIHAYLARIWLKLFETLSRLCLTDSNDMCKFQWGFNGF